MKTDNIIAIGLKLSPKAIRSIKTSHSRTVTIQGQDGELARRYGIGAARRKKQRRKHAIEMRSRARASNVTQNTVRTQKIQMKTQRKERERKSLKN